MTPAPTLTTARLLLRGPEKRDLAPFTKWVTTSARMKAVGGNDNEGNAWRGFLAGIGHWQWHGYGLFTVTDKATGIAAGRVGILHHVEWPQPELAWHVYDGFEGKSYAFEAACAVREWAGGTLGLQPLISLIAPTNFRSLNLATRLGCVEESRDKVRDEKVIVFRHLRHDDPRARTQASRAIA
ncbi:GNAT family N-acetyltransferase [Yoonia sediminilitoris]|uniref:RimJ/RimL family protein N-acetyltransferase n=1 Tax=Yoonia sediminilitoris TaxID=1286148 RepID=A0A2T6K815_9RHOB|nr:GNAT family N-acetyltransferase [Yoonia sediminilitoris]PUB10879.1 RimJ/RimL family protein N-acetyltransferase [Yoonia sediminilitoris]RCW90554.1 RimJ/RimL family protein N-acetyltransferase [Yoonia sediminilitoris]